MNVLELKVWVILFIGLLLLLIVGFGGVREELEQVGHGVVEAYKY